MSTVGLLENVICPLLAQFKKKVELGTDELLLNYRFCALITIACFSFTNAFTLLTVASHINTFHFRKILNFQKAAGLWQE